MRKYFTLLLLFISFTAFSQKLEIAFKPTQFLLKDFGLSVGCSKNRITYGLFYSFRLPTKNGGNIEPIGHGAFFGDYERQRMFNKLYTGHTIGFFTQFWLRGNHFFQIDAFYRNWSFKDKLAQFDNDEKYSFRGTRSENIDVYGIKFLLGRRINFTENSSKYISFIDIYVGFGLRKSFSNYQTYNGTIGQTYYANKGEHKKDFMLSPQLGFTIGLTKKNSP